jgi:hypothetical protein
MTTIAFKDGSVVVYPEANFINRRIEDGINELKTAHDGEVIAEIAEADIEEQHVTNPPAPEEEPVA